MPKSKTKKPVSNPKQSKEKKAVRPRKKMTIATTRKLLLFFSVLFVVLLIALSLIIIPNLSDERIVPGVIVDGLDASNLTRTELESSLVNRYALTLKGLTISMHQGEYDRQINYSDIGAEADIQKMVETAASIGHEGFFMGQIFEQIKVRKQPIQIPLLIKYSPEKMDMLLKNTYDNLKQPSLSPVLKLSNDAVSYIPGKKGSHVDTILLASRINAILQTGKSGSLHIPMIDIPPAAIDVKALHEAIVTAPKDAVVQPTTDGLATVSPHVTGKSIDLELLSDIVKKIEMRNSSFPEEVVFPVSFSQPQLTTEQAEALLFRDVLASAETTFEQITENDKNRFINIKLVAAAIDGTVLWPNEVWSFNATAGERTSEKGYKSAHAYSNGKIVDEVGGGICQVSSTLFNAALYAALDIPERHAHTYAVPYVAYGRDAAVSWGTLDLQILNVWEWPIQVKTLVSGDTVQVLLIGTNTSTDFNVKIYTKTLTTIDRERITQEDSTLPIGTARLLEPGVDGGVVQTWRKTYRGESQLSDIMLFESSYQPFPEITAIGTAPITTEIENDN